MPAAETTAPQPGQPAIEGEPSAQRAKQRYQMHGGLTDNLSVMTGTSAGSKDRAQLGLRRQLDLSNVVYFDDAPYPACSNTILLMDVGGLSTQLSEPVTITLTTDFETASNTNAANAWPTADDVSALITHPGGEMTRTSAYFLGGIVIYNELPQSNQRQFPAATITVTADRMASVVGYAVDSLASTMPSDRGITISRAGTTLTIHLPEYDYGGGAQDSKYFSIFLVAAVSGILYLELPATSSSCTNQPRLYTSCLRLLLLLQKPVVTRRKSHRVEAAAPGGCLF